jgi:hypothetical protein
MKIAQVKISETGKEISKDPMPYADFLDSVEGVKVAEEEIKGWGDYTTLQTWEIDGEQQFFAIAESKSAEEIVEEVMSEASGDIQRAILALEDGEYLATKPEWDKPEIEEAYGQLRGDA